MQDILGEIIYNISGKEAFIGYVKMKQNQKDKNY